MNNLNKSRTFAPRLLAAALIAALNMLPAGRVTAQTFTTLYSFTASHTNASGFYTNSDGANPYAGLTAAGNSNVRYGTAANGGSSGWGTVFKVNADGTGFTNLHSFTGSDGANPLVGLVLSGNTLYGTAYYGGSAGAGTVFAVNTDGTGFTNLHSFTGVDGAFPYAGLIISRNILYGTTFFTNLHSFTTRDSTGANSGGNFPSARLVLSSNTLYGTARDGGSWGYGTV